MISIVAIIVTIVTPRRSGIFPGTVVIRDMIVIASLRTSASIIVKRIRRRSAIRIRSKVSASPTSAKVSSSSSTTRGETTPATTLAAVIGRGYSHSCTGGSSRTHRVANRRPTAAPFTTIWFRRLRGLFGCLFRFLVVGSIGRNTQDFGRISRFFRLLVVKGSILIIFRLIDFLSGSSAGPSFAVSFFLGLAFLCPIFTLVFFGWLLNLNSKYVSAKIVIASTTKWIIGIFLSARQAHLLGNEYSLFHSVAIENICFGGLVGIFSNCSLFHLLLFDFIHLFHDAFDKEIRSFAKGNIGNQVIR
mmetsp:Transcript_5061/g.14937  ORF Transcript_5061/g.14937 Transcript_5061/m.14937 type:complete len:303 (-) Transcript_5061:1110-2018(-)